MGRTRLALAVVLLALPAVAGCFEDLQRVRLDAGWDAVGQLYRGPVELVDGAPAHLVVEGELSLTDDRAVELTGLDGSLSTANRTIEMQAARLSLDGETIEAANVSDASLDLTDGDVARLSLVPESADGTQLGNVTNWTAEAELTYRYREGSRFDAGRFSFEANLTARPTVGLGLGVAEASGNQVSSLVFADVPGRTGGGRADVQVFRVTSSGVSQTGNRTATLEQGTGVVLGTLDTSVEVREGQGYEILYVQTGSSTGAVAHQAPVDDQPVPGPGGWTLLAIATVAAVLLGRHRD